MGKSYSCFSTTIQLDNSPIVLVLQLKLRNLSNSNDVRQEIYRTKQVIYIVIENKIVAYTNNYKQEKFNNIIQYRQFCVIVENILQRQQ